MRKPDRIDMRKPDRIEKTFRFPVDGAAVILVSVENDKLRNIFLLNGDILTDIKLEKLAAKLLEVQEFVKTKGWLPPAKEKKNVR